MDTDSIIYIHFSAFIHYRIHLPWRVDMDINLSEYGRKEINTTYIWYACLLPYHWIYPYSHLDGSFYWYSQGPQKWPPLVILQHFSTQYHTVAVIKHTKYYSMFSSKGDIL